MRRIPSRSIPRGLTISDIVKFIPKSWKQPPSSVSRSSQTHNDPMLIESILKSLGHFASHGHLHDAFKTFSILRLQSSSAVSSDHILHSAVSLLSACVDLRAFVPGLQIHAHCISSGVEYHPAFVPKLFTFYSAFNLFGEAQSINENSDVLHPLPWNVLISSYVKNEHFKEAVSAYKRMVSKGIRPDAFTYPSVLKACGETLDFASGRVVHGSIEVSSYKCSLYVCNALISMYKRFGNVDIARRLFDRMSERDAVSWNAVISCYASEDTWDEAFYLFDQMWSAVKPSVITCNIISGGCLETGNYVGALGLVSWMRNYYKSLDPVAVIIGLKACSLLGAIRLGKEIHGFAICSGYYGIENVRNTLITMYSKCDDLRYALKVFEQIEETSLSTWNSIISGYAQANRPEEAAFLLEEMLFAGFQPNFITLASILPLCARVANLQHGKEFHCYILRRKCFKDYTMLWNSLVDVYAKSGEIVAAKRVFGLMSERDKVTYTSLIDGYGNQGKGQVALDLFREMIRSDIKPDHVTMVAVLSACSHSKLVNEGESLFKMMMDDAYKISPCLEHFSCMVDLYGRAGLVEKAKDLIKIMPYKASSAMWVTLLNACHIHGNTQIGEWAADNLQEMKPGKENPGYYVLIANMYAVAGSWTKLAEVRTLMRDLGVKKAPGCSRIETDSGSSVFPAGDISNPQACNTYPLLDGLNQLMKDTAGCAINEEQSSDEELLQEIG